MLRDAQFTSAAHRFSPTTVHVFATANPLRLAHHALTSRSLSSRRDDHRQVSARRDCGAHYITPGGDRRAGGSPAWQSRTAVKEVARGSASRLGVVRCVCMLGEIEVAGSVRLERAAVVVQAWAGHDGLA